MRRAVRILTPLSALLVGCSSSSPDPTALEACLSPPSQLLWSEQFAGAPKQRVTGLTVETNGNLSVIGWFAGGALDFGTQKLSAESDMAGFIATLDPDGHPLRLRSLGPGVLGALITPEGGVVVTLDCTAGCFGGPPATRAVAALDEAGGKLWMTTLPAGTTWARPVLGPKAELFVYAGIDDGPAMNGIPLGARLFRVDGTGNLVATLALHDATEGPLAFDPSGGFVANDLSYRTARYDAAGAKHWAVPVRGAFSVAPDGQVLLAGTFSKKLTLGSVTLTSQGKSDPCCDGPIGLDVFAFSIDPGGAPKWGVSFGDPEGDDEADAVTFDAEGRALIAGTLDFSTESFGGGELPGIAFAASLDASGRQLWQQALPRGTQYPGANSSASTIATAPGGEVYIAGAGGSPGAVGPGISIAKFSGDAAGPPGCGVSR